jgi:hypothetical protein
MRKLLSATNQLMNGDALVIMCGRDEKPWQSATVHWRINMACTC